MSEKYRSYYDGKMCLAPMVRANMLPYRLLCHDYGADLVWSEEIIDKRIIKTNRIVNEEHNTIDYVCAVNPTCIVFRTIPEERNRLVFQLGSADGNTALEAARKVLQDISSIDINMGCPKKFSVQGGMGAALLKNHANACDIIRTLSSNLDIPISAKIRFLDTLEETALFMKQLEDAGAAAITVHMRTSKMESNATAQWIDLAPLVSAVTIPVIANGDVYDRKDMQTLMEMSGCAAVMLGRPALLNASLFRKEGPYPPRKVAEDLVRRAKQYHHIHQPIKYVIQEMQSIRRHAPDRLKQLSDQGVKYGKLQEYHRVADAKSLAAFIEIFGVDDALPVAEEKAETVYKYDDAYFEGEYQENNDKDLEDNISKKRRVSNDESS